MTIHVTQFADGLPRRGFSVDDLYRMVEVGMIGEKEPIELWCGEIVAMSPKGVRHERIKNWIVRELILALGRDYGVGSENDFRLSDDSLVVPDVLVYDMGLDLDGLTAANALLAIEVAASSLARDRGRKAQLYAACGVREMWVVDAETLVTRIHRQPTPTGYHDVRDIAADGEARASLVDVSLRMADFER